MKNLKEPKKKRIRNPELIQAVVLEAGTNLFAENGFAGTSLRDVSELSGVSVGLIQYHFGTKKELYDAVRKHALAEYIAAQEPQFALPRDDFDQFIDKGLRLYFRFYEQNPAWHRLAAWAILERDKRVWPGEYELMDRLAERIHAAQRAGSVRQDIDPELLLIVVGGMMRSWLIYRERYASRLKHFGDEQTREDAYLALCIELLSLTESKDKNST